MKRRPTLWFGHRREIDGQSFEVAASRPVTYPSGKMRTVLTWTTRCAACGRRFEFATARKPRDEDLRRLCRRHHVTRRDVRRAIRRLLVVEAATADAAEDHETGHGPSPP